MYYNTNHIILIILFLLALFICRYIFNNKLKNNENFNPTVSTRKQADFVAQEQNQQKKKIRQCPAGLIKFCGHGSDYQSGEDGNCDPTSDTLDKPIYCSYSGDAKSSKGDLSFCTLTPELGDEETTIDGHTKAAPVCATVPCPSDDFVLTKHDQGGICYNKKTGYRCALDAERSGEYEICDKKEDYLIYKNIDIIEPNMNSLSIASKSKSSMKECADMCNRAKPITNKDGTAVAQTSIKDGTVPLNLGGDLGGCDFFTFRKSGTQKGECKLKKKIGSGDNIKKNSTIDTYMKLPINYKMYKNMNINSPTLPSGRHSNMTIMECAKLCDEDPNCSTFTTGTNSMAGQCELKGRINDNLTPDNNKTLFSVNYKYKPHDQFRDKSGHLCKYENEVIATRDKITAALKNEDVDFKKNLDYITNKHDEMVDNLEEKIKLKTQKTTLNFLINPKSIIMWTGIKTQCKKVEIKLLRKEYLQVSYIQIMGNIKKGDENGVVDLFNMVPKVIEASSVMPDKKYNEIMKYSNYYTTSAKLINNIDNCYGEYDLEKFFSTDYEQNPTITINFYPSNPLNEVVIHKIFVYNRLDANQNRLVPLSIKLYNKDNYIVRSALKKSFKEPLIVSDPPPPVPDEFAKNINYYDLKIGSNLGEPDMIQEWVDLTGSNVKDTYCSIIKNKKNEAIRNVEENTDIEENDDQESDINNYHYQVRCVNLNNVNNPYLTGPIDPGYSKTQYFKNSKKTKKAEFCRCMGKPPNTFVRCVPYTNKDKFSLEEYIDENKPTGCQNMTGKYLKNVNEGKNEKCEDILVDKYIPFGKKVVSNEKVSLLKVYKEIHNNIINAGFYYFDKKSFYLFKNTKLNNKQVVLFAIYKGGDTKRIFKVGIVNNNTFPDLNPININVNLYEGIDACCYFDRRHVYFFRDKYFVKYDMIKKKHVPDDHVLISRKWPQIPYIFTYNLTAAVCRNKESPSKTWLFKGTSYIEISLSNNEDSDKVISSPKNINIDLGIKLSEIDTALIESSKGVDILYLFNKHMHVKHNLNEDTIISEGTHNKMLLQNNKNIWDLNTFI